MATMAFGCVYVILFTNLNFHIAMTSHTNKVSIRYYQQFWWSCRKSILRMGNIPLDWWSQGSNMGPLVYKASSLSNTPQWLLGTTYINHVLWMTWCNVDIGQVWSICWALVFTVPTYVFWDKWQAWTQNEITMDLPVMVQCQSVVKNIDWSIVQWLMT